MRRKVGIGEIGVILADLLGGELAFVDDDPRRERIAVVQPHLLLGRSADGVVRLLANEEELAFELFLREVGLGGDEGLFDEGLGGLRAGADHGVVDRHAAPSEHGLALVGDKFFDDEFADFAEAFVLREEEHSDGVFARRGEEASKLFVDDLREKAVRHADENTRAVAGVDFASARAAVVHVFEHGERIDDDVVARDAFDLRDEADAAGIFFGCGVVEALLDGLACEEFDFVLLGLFGEE